MRRAAVAVAVVLLTLLPLSPLAAQGASTDIITGTVTSPMGTPLPGARIVATSAETGVSRTATSNAQGRYTIAFPGGGGQYRLTVSAPGLSPTTMTVGRQADEDLLVANVRLETTPVEIAGVTVRAQQRRGNPNRPEPGSQERALSGDQLQRLPVDPTDLEQIATLTPGVVSVSGDSLSGFSILGQGPAGNQITLDGVSFGGGEGFGGGMGTGVPAEAVRVTRVITNTYDVSRGQFSGGQVATTTRGGTNQLQGQFSYALRDPSLEWTGSETPFSGSVRLDRLSGGVGGPIVRDRFFYFGALSFQRRSEGIPSLVTADPLSLERLGVSPDSVQRLLQLAAGTGVYDPDAAVPDDRVGENGSAIGRLDLNLGSAHTLTLRGNGQWSDQDAMRVGPLDLPQGGGTSRSRGGGLMLSLTSRFGNGWVNELRAYGSRNRRDTDPDLLLPQARVRVSSVLESGATGISTLGFGGGSVASHATTDAWEASDELSLVLGTSHRVRVGGVLTSTDNRQTTGANQYGTFTFNSLEDLAAGRPASFTRTLAQQERQSGGLNGALYVGDSWRASDRLQLTYGTRVESSWVSALPEYNPVVEETFGRRTDRIPSELAFTPRVGFSYTLSPSQGGPPAGVIRGGFGAFRAAPAWSLFSAARDLTGLPGGQSQLRCVGEAVPVPDWDAYLDDPAAVPTSCLGAASPLPTSGRGTSVAVFLDDYRTSQSWRASLGFQRRFLQFLGASVDATFAEGVHQQGVRDLNLRDTPAFTLTSEGGRPVYVPASAIVPATGETGYFASRLHPEFGQVMEIDSDLRSRTLQLTLGLNGFVPRLQTFFSASYTTMRARDQGSAGGWGFGRFGGFGGIGSLPTTGGNPNEPEWGTSEFERRHSFTATLGRSFRSWIDLSVIGRASSGSPYSPIVGGDVNGDGARNDLAFVFDPATTADPALAESMSRLLATVPEGARACLESQLGRIAERSSCRNPWSYSLDLRFNLHPELPRVGRRLTIAVDAVNTLSGVDRLLHGESGLRGWGQFQRADAVLLYPRGFDPATERYRYEVNERFGSTRSSTVAIRNPFQVQVQAQLSVGPSRGGGAGGFGGFGGRGGGPGGGGGFDPALLAERAFPNPLVGILALADTLGLDSAQVVRLGALSDSLQQKQDSLAASLQPEGGSADARRDPGELFRTLQPKLQQSRANVAAALEEARKVLTPEQWDRVPERLRNPPRGFGGGRGAGPG
jgi:hypothetical protein